MKGSELELGIKPLTFSQNEDFAGLNMYYRGITSVHHNNHTGMGTRETRPTKNKLERRNQ